MTNLSNLYYSGIPNHSRYNRRIAQLVTKRSETLQFVTAAVGLSLGLNILASVLYSKVPLKLALPISLIGLVLLALASYLAMWRGSDYREIVPILIISEIGNQGPHELRRTFALVSGCGYGVTQEISKIMIDESGPIIDDRKISRVEYLSTETMLWLSICQGYKEGWYFPDVAAENLNVSWAEGAASATETETLDLKNSVPLTAHPFSKQRNNKSTFQAPKGTRLKITRDELRSSTFKLINDYVTLSCELKWQGKGFPNFVINSPWVPRHKQQHQVVYNLTINVKYTWRAKIPFNGRSMEYMRWAERMVDYLLHELSFRSFELDREQHWRNKEIEAIEKLLGVSRWKQ